MSLTRSIRLGTATLGAVAIAVGLLAGPAQARSESAPASAPARTDAVTRITDRIAGQLAGEFAADAAKAGLFPVGAEAVNLTRAPETTPLGRAVREANRAVLTAKGLPQDGTGLLTVRLADAGMVDALRAGVAPLVASSPSDDEATSVTAYERGGHRVLLAADRLPQRPVYLVEIDSATALAKGTEVLNTVLAQRGVAIAAPAVSTTSGYWATQITSIRLNDDMEPWHKGDAEIFALVAGFGLDGKAAVESVQLPYLNNDGTTYYPYQLLVHFSAYKYNLADVVMMEEDSGTNYRDLAIAISTALLTIVDGGMYIPLVNAILNAIPNDWWVDDPDYVDSWYTLATYTSGTRNGAAGNGRMTVVPYWVAPL